MSRKGTFGEDCAAGFLLDAGFAIVERNFRTPYGEIDIIAEDGTYIVFVEVKARASGRYGLPREAVTPVKRRRIVRTAMIYLSQHTVRKQPRFDVIEVLCDSAFARVLEVSHIKNAFEVSDEAF